jgi:hypothetical protein
MIHYLKQTTRYHGLHVVKNAYTDSTSKQNSKSRYVVVKQFWREFGGSRKLAGQLVLPRWWGHGKFETLRIIALEAHVITKHHPSLCPISRVQK